MITMEENPDMEDVTVEEYPQNTVLTGTVQSVRRGERQEFFDESEYGDPDDTLLELEIMVEHEGETYNVNEYIRQPETITTRHKMGQFVKRYGSPSPGQEIKVDFDEEGQSSVIV